MKGKTIDQVTDMMVANAQNLIITIKPANQRNTLDHRAAARQQYEYENGLYSQNSTNLNRIGESEGRHSATSSGFSTSEKGRYMKSAAPPPPTTNNPHQNLSYESEDDEEEDEIVDHTNSTTYRIR